MCGVFGFISANGSGPDVDRLESIARATQTRGMHAHGLAWIDQGGRLRRFKAPGPIGRNIRCLDFVGDAKMLIGHCRYSTVGNPRDNGNNHPHSCDGGWFVHNGTIFNHHLLADQFELPVTTGCDSEVLGLTVEALEGTLLDRCGQAMNLIEGPGVMLGLWSRPARMIVARRGKPLHVMQSANGDVYFGSLPAALRNPDRILDNTVRLLSVKHDGIFQQIERIEPCPRRNPEKDPPLGRPLRHYELPKTSARRSSAFA